MGDARVRTTEDSTLLLLLIAVSLAFAWILWPFYGAILWAIVFATVFAPAHRGVLSFVRQRPNLAAYSAAHRDDRASALDADSHVRGAGSDEPL